MNIKKTLKALSDAPGIGCIRSASEIAKKELSRYAEVSTTDNLGIIGRIPGKSDRTLMIEAHIDEIGFIVTAVDDKGFLTVSTCGGIDLRALPSRQVDIHGKRTVRGVFCSTPPHLSEGDITFDKISDMKIDSCLGESAKDVISVGDYVTFCTKSRELAGDLICGKSFDDRAGICVLLELASRFSKKTPPLNLAFCLSDMEEIGLRGAKTATYGISPDEAIAIDVSFGDGPEIDPNDCGKIGKGAMIGVSPIIDREISDKLIRIAAESEIPYQTEVMSSRTGTDADTISLNKNGVRTGLVSIPLRNMHTDCEIISVSDITRVCDLLENYIEGGGLND
ncbi:MAG: M42 family peptidase [Clostridia bacterium]|nr:M42 family peptidase [Clostridia bacterium]